MTTTKGRAAATKPPPIAAKPEVSFRCVGCGEFVTTTFVGSAYVRISEDKRHDEHGVTNQKPQALGLSCSLGWHVPEWAVYVDNDKSATKAHVRREDYERLLADMEGGRVHGVTATFSDRIYRRLAELERLITVVEANNVAIRTVHSGEIDLTTASGRMVARILGSVATHEGEVKAERMRLANAAAREEGKMVTSGLRLFGYNRDGSINKTEAKVLHGVVRRLMAGQTITSVCHWLNDSGVRTTQGNKWQITGLNRLLTNPRIAGHSVYRGRIVGRGEWEPLLDQETWEALHALLSSANRRRGRSPRVALLPGLVFCGRCGAAMRTGGRGSGKGNQGPHRVRTYRCNTDPGPYGGCGRVSVLAEPVEKIVEDVARLWLNDARARAHLAKVREHDAVSGLPGEVSKLRTRLAQLEDALAEEDEDVLALRAAAKKVRTRLTDAEAKLASMASHAMPLPDLDAEWPTDLAARRRLVDLAVERVVINPGRGQSFDRDRVKVETVPIP